MSHPDYAVLAPAAASSAPYMEPSFSASLYTSAAVAATAAAQVINLKKSHKVFIFFCEIFSK